MGVTPKLAKVKSQLVPVLFKGLVILPGTLQGLAWSPAQLRLLRSVFTAEVLGAWASLFALGGARAELSVVRCF